MVYATLEQEVLYSVLQIQTPLALDLYSTRNFSWPRLKGGLNLVMFQVDRTENPARFNIKVSHRR